MDTIIKSNTINLQYAHPLIIKLFTEVAKHISIQILDARRGRAAQELAFRQGHSEVHFGDSAHNWVPAVAVDVVPLPLNWNSAQPFIDLGQKFVLPIAKQMGIKIRWGADFNMNGNYTDDHFKDLPHYELFPWRDWAHKDSKLYTG